MNSDFSDAERAVIYLSSGLANAFPDAEAEVIAFLTPHAPARHTIVSMKDIRSALERACRNFRGASVWFDPKQAYGFVARIEARPDLVAGGKAFHPEDEPRVAVLIRRNHKQDVMVGARNRMPRQSHRPVTG